MPSYNKVILMGNLTRDPELKYTASGTAICKIGLAVNRKYKTDGGLKDDTCFVDITIWDKQGENCNQYLTKGSGVLVEGRLNFSSWVSPEGIKRSKLDVVAENVQFLPKSGERRENSSQSEEVEKMGVSDDEIPF